VSGAGVANRLLDPTDLGDGRLLYELPLGFREGAANPPKPGFRGRLRVTASPSNAG
jgi:hypothetical protein